MAHRAIRERMAEDYVRLGGYEAVAAEWGVGSAMVWRVVNEGYWPADAGIREKLFVEARRRGLGVRRRGRKRDLFAMPVEELRWRLVNRS